MRDREIILKDLHDSQAINCSIANQSVNRGIAERKLQDLLLEIALDSRQLQLEAASHLAHISDIIGAYAQA